MLPLHQPALQWGDQQLPVPPAGSIQVAWSPGCVAGPHALPPAARAALEGAAQRAVAAFGSEAVESGGAYGRAALVRLRAGATVAPHSARFA